MAKFLRTLVYNITWFANGNNFTFFYLYSLHPSLTIFLQLFPRTTKKRNGNSSQPALIPDFNEITSSFSLFRIILVERMFPPVLPTFSMRFTMKACFILWKTFLASSEMIIEFLSVSLFMIYYFYRLTYIEPTLLFQYEHVGWCYWYLLVFGSLGFNWEFLHLCLSEISVCILLLFVFSCLGNWSDNGFLERV